MTSTGQENSFYAFSPRCSNAAQRLPQRDFSTEAEQKIQLCNYSGFFEGKCVLPSDIYRTHLFHAVNAEQPAVCVDALHSNSELCHACLTSIQPVHTRHTQ